MIFVNQTELVGSILPNVYFRKITLENGGSIDQTNNPHVDVEREPETVRDPRTGKLKRFYVQPDINRRNESSLPLRVTVDLLLKESFDDSLIGNWFNNVDFSKYIKINIIQVTDESLTNEVLKDHKVLNLFTLKKLEDSIVDRVLQNTNLTLSELDNSIKSNITEKIIDLKQDISLEQINKTVSQNGNLIVDIPFQVEFILPDSNPNYLSYFAYSYIDFRQLAEDQNISFDFTSNFEFGKISAEEVIKNNQVSSTSYVYVDDKNEIWAGPIQQKDNFQFVGITSSEEIPLKRITSGNSTVQDFRIFERLIRTEIDTTNLISRNILKNISNISDNLLKNRRSYFTQFYLSRDLDGNARFLFGFDYNNFIIDNAKFGNLFRRQEANLDDSALISINLYRKRIKGSPELGSKPELDKPFNKKDAIEFIISSGEHQYKSFQKSERENIGVLKEISLDIDQGIRFFTGIDKEIKDFTDGYYVYEIDVKIKDPSIIFVKNLINKLDNSINSITKLIVDAQNPDNFDIQTNRFKDLYLQRFTTDSDHFWNIAIEDFISVFKILTGKTFERNELQSIYFALHPATSNISSISRVIDLIDNIKSRLSSFIEKYPSDKGSQFNSSRRVKPSISSLNILNIYHSFKDIFNSNIENETGLDYLDIPMKKDSQDGLKVFSGQEFAERADRETNTYYDLKGDLKPNIDIKKGGDFYNPGDSLDLTSWSYLSPAKISLQNTIQLQRIGNSPTPNNLDLKLADLGSLIRNYNIFNALPRRENIESSLSLERATTNLINNIGISIAPLNNRPRQLPPQIIIQNRDENVIDSIVIEQKDCSTRDPGTYLLSLQLFNNIKSLSSPIDKINNNLFEKESDPISLATFDLADQKNFLNRLAEDISLIHSNSFFQGAPHNTVLSDTVKALPNQIKALLLSKSNLSIIKKNWFDRNTDPLLTPDEEFEFKFSYLKLQAVQVFIGFKTNLQGEPIIQSPLWEPLTVGKFNNSFGKNLLCRLKFYENNIIGIKKDDILDLPVYDRYFLLKPFRLAEEPISPKVIDFERENLLQLNIRTEFLSNLLVK